MLSSLRNEHHKRANQLGKEESYDEIIRRRFVALQYDDDGGDDDSGGGDIASSLAQSALSLGTSFAVSQLQPTTTSAPQQLRPPAATGALSSPSSSIILIAVGLFVVVIAFVFISKA